MNTPPTPTPAQIEKLPKWAREYFEHLTEQAGLAAALRFTPPVEPDLDPNAAECTSRDVHGWLPRGGNVLGSIGHQCDPSETISGPVSHWPASRRSCGSQGARRLFSRRVDALRATRNEAERTAAKELWRIDKLIAAEIANPTPLSEPVKQ